MVMRGRRERERESKCKEGEKGPNNTRIGIVGGDADIIFRPAVI